VREIEQESFQRLFEKVQVNIRMSRPVLKVLRATAEYMDMSFAGLMETIAVTALEGQRVFRPAVMKQIEQFKEIYGMNAMHDALAKAIEEGEEDDEET
jgi:hypothetical protein